MGSASIISRKLLMGRPGRQYTIHGIFIDGARIHNGQEIIDGKGRVLSKM
jgi:hypothetical protein